MKERKKNETNLSFFPRIKKKETHKTLLWKNPQDTSSVKNSHVILIIAKLITIYILFDLTTLCLPNS